MNISNLFVLSQFILRINAVSISYSIQPVSLWKSGSDSLFLLTTPQYLHKSLIFLKKQNNFCFSQMNDLVCADFPKNKFRFSLYYCLLSLHYDCNIVVIINTNEVTPVPSVTSIYESANWSEREVWDLYGVYFTRHPNLDRILTDYGFEGHPLRKSFPLTGFEELMFSPSQNKFIYNKTYTPLLEISKKNHFVI